MKRILIFVAINFIVFISNGQQLVYTISSTYHNAEIFLDSILFENTSNGTSLIVNNLPVNTTKYIVDLSNYITDIKSIKDDLTQNEFRVVKNIPGLITIVSNLQRNENVLISITNAAGKVCYRQSLNISPERNNLDIKLEGNGIYFISLQSSAVKQTFKGFGDGSESFKTTLSYKENKELAYVKIKNKNNYQTNGFKVSNGNSLKITVFRFGFNSAFQSLQVSGSQNVKFTVLFINPRVKFTYSGNMVEYATVFHNGRIWMDRNLGAAQVASTINDSLGFGDLFQWGRGDDGHQLRKSDTTSLLAPARQQPGHNKFIVNKTFPNDWNSDNSWVTRWVDSGYVKTGSYICPKKWRIPKFSDLNLAFAGFLTPDGAGAYNSEIKLPLSGYRYNRDAGLKEPGTGGYYWSDSLRKSYLYLTNKGASFSIYGNGYYASSVRCVLDNNGECFLPPTPGKVHGYNVVGSGAIQEKYSVDSVAGISTYRWVVTGDATIVSGQSTRNVLINFGKLSGSVGVQTVNDCGGSLFSWFAVTVENISITNLSNSLVDYLMWDAQGNYRNHIATLSDEGTTNYYAGPTYAILNKGTWLNQPNAPEIGFSNTNLGTYRGTALSNAIYSVRLSNLLLRNIPKIDTLTQAQRDVLLGQAYFFRAWNYFEIIKRWGGMPILDTVYNNGDTINLQRKTYHESTAWLYKDIDKAISLLPDTWPDSIFDRPTKTSAMAVKEMAALYDASPLMHNSLDTIINNGYDVERCKIAARYANDILKYLQSKPTLPYKLVDSAEYKNMFYRRPTQKNNEALWFKNKPLIDSRSIRCLFMTQRYANGFGIDGQACSVPTYNLVSNFEILNNGNAYPQDDSRSGYDPQHPFSKRDPRFYKSILTPGEPWGLNLSMQQVYIETWSSGPGGGDGLDYFSGSPQRNSPSSLFCKKFWPVESNGWQNDYNYSYTINYIRLTQIYLDYAEAMNEAYGPVLDPEGYGLTALGAINIIRSRVGVPNVLAEFTATKELFRERIRNERAVELMFENQRWWDIRRWMIAEAVFQTPIQGFGVSLKVAGSNPSLHQFNFSVINIPNETRVFQRKHYWYPIVPSYMSLYKNFQQNPGW